jgi:hypothetical protein
LDSSIIQGPFPVAPCQALISRFAPFGSAYAGAEALAAVGRGGGQQRDGGAAARARGPPHAVPHAGRAGLAVSSSSSSRRRRRSSRRRIQQAHGGGGGAHGRARAARAHVARHGQRHPRLRRGAGARSGGGGGGGGGTHARRPSTGDRVVGAGGREEGSWRARTPACEHPEHPRCR